MNNRKFHFTLLIAATILATGFAVIHPLFAAETLVSTLAKNTHFHGISVDPGDPSHLYLATHHGLYTVTSDGGADRISSNGNDYMGFTPHPTNPNVLYGSGHPVGGGNMGFITSINGGKTWEKLADGVDGPVDFHQMDVSKVDPNIVVGVSGGLQMSKDGGRSWVKVGPAPNGLIDLAASSKDINTFYAVTKSGLVRSMDGGLSWNDAHLLRRAAAMVHVASDGTAYAYQIGTGLIRTSEPGLNWELVNNGFGDAYILHFAVDPSDAQKLYAITFNSKTRTQVILASMDGGASWNRLGDV